MMPVPLTTGGLGAIPLSSGEANRWLREMLLQQGFQAAAVKNVGTHSLKATTLSWCAKFGIARELRQVLGYHSIPGVKAMLHYSRDEQA
eukprot:3179988-Amphidinium_carterae.1